ncbi:hypothetical protein [Orbus mooreae]|uniref:hypothetical protein n=1 Tax=Orbus mooreae TaxID=3074107 RepID=UPI00370D4927
MKGRFIIKTILLLGSVILISYPALANRNIQSVIDAFTNCDSGFFYQLKNNASDFEDITDLVLKEQIAYIPVKDIASNEGNTHYFMQPIEYRGLTIIGYQNIYIETSYLGKYYYWGFIINGSIDDVKQSLNQLSWQKYNITSYVTNTQLYDRQQKNVGWRQNPYVIDGVVPRLFTIEKSLYLEPINENQIHLVCSLQGDIDKPLLYTMRPDMADIDKLANDKRIAEIEKNDSINTPNPEQQNNHDITTVQELTKSNTQNSEDM